MNALLALSRAIDAITERLGRIVYWLILVVVLISAANASVRKAFNYSSNSFLEIQWYLFSVIFLFLAGYTLKNNEHVRIDIIAGRLSARAQNWIDVIGIVLFLWPMSFVIMPVCLMNERRSILSPCLVYADAAGVNVRLRAAKPAPPMTRRCVPVARRDP